MSVENVEAVRAAYEAFRSGDLEGVGKNFADNVEWESPDTLPTGGVFRGRDAVLGSFGDPEVLEQVQRGPGRVHRCR